MNWTKGPWRIMNGEEIISVREVYGRPILVCTVYDSDIPYDENMANLRLIAKAPEMAELLESISATIIHYPDGKLPPILHRGTASHKLEEFIEKARQILEEIKKAKA